MGKLFNWFKRNVMNNEEMKYRVYLKKYKDRTFRNFEIVFLDVMATSNVHAKEEALKIIEERAKDKELYKFIKLRIL